MAGISAVSNPDFRVPFLTTDAQTIATVRKMEVPADYPSNYAYRGNSNGLLDTAVFTLADPECAYDAESFELRMLFHPAFYKAPDTADYLIPDWKNGTLQSRYNPPGVAPTSSTYFNSFTLGRNPPTLGYIRASTGGASVFSYKKIYPPHAAPAIDGGIHALLLEVKLQTAANLNIHSINNFGLVANIQNIFGYPSWAVGTHPYVTRTRWKPLVPGKPDREDMTYMEQNVYNVSPEQYPAAFLANKCVTMSQLTATGATSTAGASDIVWLPQHYITPDGQTAVAPLGGLDPRKYVYPQQGRYLFYNWSHLPFLRVVKMIPGFLFRNAFQFQITFQHPQIAFYNQVTQCPNQPDKMIEYYRQVDNFDGTTYTQATPCGECELNVYIPSAFVISAATQTFGAGEFWINVPVDNGGDTTKWRSDHLFHFAIGNRVVFEQWDNSHQRFVTVCEGKVSSYLKLGAATFTTKDSAGNTVSNTYSTTAINGLSRCKPSAIWVCVNRNSNVAALPEDFSSSTSGVLTVVPWDKMKLEFTDIAPYEAYFDLKAGNVVPNLSTTLPSWDYQITMLKLFATFVKPASNIVAEYLAAFSSPAGISYAYPNYIYNQQRLLVGSSSNVTTLNIPIAARSIQRLSMWFTSNHALSSNVNNNVGYNYNGLTDFALRGIIRIQLQIGAQIFPMYYVYTDQERATMQWSEGLAVCGQDEHLAVTNVPFNRSRRSTSHKYFAGDFGVIPPKSTTLHGGDHQYYSHMNFVDTGTTVFYFDLAKKQGSLVSGVDTSAPTPVILSITFDQHASGIDKYVHTLASIWSVLTIQKDLSTVRS